MEAIATNNDSRKRARDEGPDNAEVLEAKKQECPKNDDVRVYEKRYKFYDGIGVFDFPWLKEGLIFNLESFFEDQEEKFASSLCLDEAGASFEQQILCLVPNSDTKKDEVDGDDSFWSLHVDDLDMWSCVIDHPLDLGFNKR